MSQAARRAERQRTTRETSIRVSVDLDGSGVARIATGVGFYDHLLTSLAHHALLDLDIEANGRPRGRRAPHRRGRRAGAGRGDRRGARRPRWHHPFR